MASVWTCTSVNEHFKIKLLLEFEFASSVLDFLLFVLEKDGVFFHIGAPVDLAQLVADPDNVDDEDHQGRHSCTKVRKAISARKKADIGLIQTVNCWLFVTAEHLVRVAGCCKMKSIVPSQNIVV